MGRTIPSFRQAFAEELTNEWKEYRHYLDKKQRAGFDNMIAHVYNYTSACSMAAHPILMYPVIISLLLDHYRELIAMQNELGIGQENKKQPQSQKLLD